MRYPINGMRKHPIKELEHILSKMILILVNSKNYPETEQKEFARLHKECTDFLAIEGNLIETKCLAGYVKQLKELKDQSDAKKALGHDHTILEKTRAYDSFSERMKQLQDDAIQLTQANNESAQKLVGKYDENTSKMQSLLETYGPKQETVSTLSFKAVAPKAGPVSVVETGTVSTLKAKVSKAKPVIETTGMDKDDFKEYTKSLLKAHKEVTGRDVSTLDSGTFVQVMDKFPWKVENGAQGPIVHLPDDFTSAVEVVKAAIKADKAAGKRSMVLDIDDPKLLAEATKICQAEKMEVGMPEVEKTNAEKLRM
jgi:hypothetical protein